MKECCPNIHIYIYIYWGRKISISLIYLKYVVLLGSLYSKGLDSKNSRNRQANNPLSDNNKTTSHTDIYSILRKNCYKHYTGQTECNLEKESTNKNDPSKQMLELKHIQFFSSHPNQTHTRQKILKTTRICAHLQNKPFNIYIYIYIYILQCEELWQFCLMVSTIMGYSMLKPSL